MIETAEQLLVLLPSWLSYVVLFGLAFVSASLVPFGSSWFVVLLLAQGHDAMLIWLVATLGNVFGGLLNYVFGYYASDWVRSKQTPERWQRAEGWFNRYGQWSLLFSWLPVVGDPLTLVAGVMRSPLSVFLILVTIGKALRYAFFVFSFDAVVSML